MCVNDERDAIAGWRRSWRWSWRGGRERMVGEPAGVDWVVLSRAVVPQHLYSRAFGVASNDARRGEPWLCELEQQKDRMEFKGVCQRGKVGMWGRGVTRVSLCAHPS